MRYSTRSAKTEGVHAVRGVYRSLSFVPRGAFRSFPRSIEGTSPLLQEVISEHFSKGCVPDANDIAKRGA